MSKKLPIIIVGIILVVLIGIYFGSQKKGGITPNVLNQETQENQQGEISETGEGTITDKLSQLKKIYQGFKEAKTGDWAEWDIKESDNIPSIKYVFVGKETINGKDCYGWEFSSKFEGKKAAFQVWLSKEDNNLIKYVAKIPKIGTICLSPEMYQSQGEFSPQVETPHEYSPESIINLNFEIGEFTTISGKIVKVVKVINLDKGQVWLSSQVPFGIVKVISPEGKTEVEIKDFGTGAPLEITKNERDNCGQFPTGLFPGF